MNAMLIKEVDSWKKSRELANAIYFITREPPFNNDFEFKSLIRNSSTEIVSNISEGLNGESYENAVCHLLTAREKTGDVRAQLFVALKLDYITREQFDDLETLASDTAIMLFGLINLVRNGLNLN